MAHFDTVYMAPRVRVALNSIFQPQYARKFWDLINKLRSGRFDLKGLRVEKLHTKKGKVYSARLNVEIRVIFSMYSRGDKRSLVIWDANHHDDAYDRVDRASVPFGFQEISGDLEPIMSWGAGGERPIAELSQETSAVDNEDLTDGLLLFEVPHYVLAEPNKYNAFERNIDRYLRLTEEQEGLIEKHDKAYLVQGSAGTGKTTLALFHALNLYERSPEDDIFFFTYQEELACVCRCYKVNLVGEEEAADNESGLRVFSYLEFCRHYLRKHLDSKQISWQWIPRETSLAYLEEIINSKSRWSRSIEVGDTYSYIYSILKGRFVPGSDNFPETPEDYARIFKGYGTTPKNLDELMEIFRLYEARLQRSNKRDEADLIRYCYHSMKDTAILSSEKKATWIVIDEVQDFTELELKSILLFWSNKSRLSGGSLSFPFLSGDRNQNISRSGFRWQEVDSYVESILKKMHRPNSLVKVKLHTNFRNTLEIFQLGKFILEAAPDVGGDIGTPPRFSSGKPTIVIGQETEFLDFLKSVAAGDKAHLPAPLVVLFEEDGDLRSIRARVPLDDGLFLMPLRRSKGMEFEDCILYRLFSSIKHITEDTGQDMVARLFDLWYMAVTRARRNLLIFLTPDDWAQIKTFFNSRYEEMLVLVDFVAEGSQEALAAFFDRSEKYVPNYNVIFLEKVKAQESWDESRTAQLSAAEREALQQQSLRLWKKCRDWNSLGKAYQNLGQYQQAIPYLKLSNLPLEVARCYEQLGQIEEAAQFYEEAHELMEAARCYESLGHFQKAAELYEINREWMKAGINYAQASDSKKAAACFEKAENWLEAANFYKLRAEWLKAAELFAKANKFESAAEMYLKVKDKLDAARCFISAGLHGKAAPLLESLNRWAEAAESYAEAGNFDKAAALFAKAGRLKDVAACARQAGDWVTAASAYERMKNWPLAAEAMLALGNKGKAAEFFENAQDWKQALNLLLEMPDWLRAGRCCERLDDYDSAVQHYLKANAFNEAAYCCEKQERYDEAARYYLQDNNSQAAAAMMARTGRKLEAARYQLLSGQVVAALELARNIAADDPLAQGRSGDLRLELAVWAEQTERPDIAAAIYEQVGQLMLAGNRYKQAMLMGKAAACFEKDQKFALAADLYLQDGQFERAAICYRAVRQFKKAGQCFEKGKCWQQAAEMYGKAGDVEAARRCQTSSQWL